MLEIRPTRPEDLAGLAGLFADRFGHGLPREDWEWKYRQIPGAARSLVAVEAGSVVAHAGAVAVPARWRHGEARAEGNIWMPVDFAGTTRRRGLRAAMVDLGRTLLDSLPGAGDAPWMFGFPSERHFELGTKAIGYVLMATVEPLAGVIPTVPPGSLADVAIETSDSCGDWAEAVWERCGGLGIRRSAAFLNWRYCARPRRYYRFYRMASGGEEGFAVFAFVPGEARAAEVWLPPAGRWLPSLLAVAADLRAAGFGAWRFWPGPGLASGLREELGLRPTGEVQLVGGRDRRGPGPDPLAARAGFPYAMGDYDMV
jgi:hypothetical protein